MGPFAEFVALHFGCSPDKADDVLLPPSPEEARDPQPLLANDDYCAEEMLKGERLLVSKHGSVVSFFRRNGVEYAAMPAVVDFVRMLPGDFVLDGELVEGTFIAFDILSLDGTDWTIEPFINRRELLERCCPFPIVAHATGEVEKAALLAGVRAAGGEGVVFKRLDAAYEPELPTYSVKYKF